VLILEEIEAGAQCTHKNTRLRYTVVDVDVEGDEILLEAATEGHEPLTVASALFASEFVLGERYAGPRRTRGRGRGRRAGRPAVSPNGPRAKGRVKKMVRDRGFGFIRGEDGKEVFFHRSGMNSGDYDAVEEGDTVEYVVQEGPRGARAEHVRSLAGEPEAQSAPQSA